MTALAASMRGRHPKATWVPAVGGVALVGAVVGGIGWAAANASYDTFAGVTVAVVLVLATVPVIRRLAAAEPDRRIGQLLLIAPFLKLGAALARFGVANVVYDGVADAGVYHVEGIRLSEPIRDGIFSLDLGRAFVGTGFVRFLTGLLYSVTGPTQLGAFFVFSWLGFWGLYLFYRAFVIACPHGDHWRYARLIFLLPSLLFWPSSLGKEAWMCLGLGLGAYGAARLLMARRGGLLALASGMGMAALVRPHVAAIGVMAVLVGYLARRTPVERRSLRAALGKLVGLVVIGIGLVFVLRQAGDRLGIDSYSTDALAEARQTTALRTTIGGSEFETIGGSSLSITKFPEALISVLFRPFPWEVRNLQAFIASVEGMALLLFFAFGWRRLLSAVRDSLRTPYVVVCVTYAVLFVYGFSSFGNFGILTRQRVQVLPFVLVLVCLPVFRAKTTARWRSLLVDDDVAGDRGRRERDPTSRDSGHLARQRS